MTKIILWQRRRHGRHHLDGSTASVKELAAQVGVEKSYPFDMLKEFVGKAIAQRRKIHFLPPYRYDNMMLLEDLTGIRASMTKKHASLELIKQSYRCVQ